MRELQIFEIDITKGYKLSDWQDDLKMLLKNSGSKGINHYKYINI